MSDSISQTFVVGQPFVPHSFITGQMCVDLVFTPIAALVGKLYQGATSVLCVSSATSVADKSIYLFLSVCLSVFLSAQNFVSGTRVKH